ncbi:hypothetical protein PpBr36_04584 [Pyricularia pennisetigena]|uniref:hypothetical protein n=1 Tax=Pyricularia pennisetigena TaxID=1578925 RepID=UPI00114E8498|nr:hypothetical protein PpBr36_04584 [Pyricularia pennisetigena]TLS26398.1 hypothetical protein PpBr36_04584 [Pyricularia pennisetigena]
MSLSPAPAISASEKHIAGHMVTVHGLSELNPEASHVSILWLHHGRTRSSADMADIAARTVGAWNQEQQSKERGLIGVAFDQRNHGTREIFPRANDAWRGGNPYHAQDMFGLISGAVVDTGLLIDLIQGNIFPEKPDGYVDAHYVLGVSLGGHSTWQLLFADERVTAGVVIIGCPDYMYRARLSRLPTFSTEDNGASFIGSKDFPPDLVRACEKYDPRGLVFGPRKTPSWPLPVEQEPEAKRIVTSRLRGKRMLSCSGGDDKLVPYYCSKPFVDFMKGVQKEWSELDVVFDDRVYAGAGHEFSPGMVTDAVKFLVETTRAEGSRQSGKSGESEHGFESAPSPLVVTREKLLTHPPGIPRLALSSQRVPSAVGVLCPLPNDFCNLAHYICFFLRDLPITVGACCGIVLRQCSGHGKVLCRPKPWRKAGRVDADVADMLKGKPDGGAVSVDYAGLLEGMADYRDLPRPCLKLSPEGNDGKEDVVVRVQSLFLENYAGRKRDRRQRVRFCAEIIVRSGKVRVAACLGEARFLPCWASKPCGMSGIVFKTIDQIL